MRSPSAQRGVKSFQAQHVILQSSWRGDSSRKIHEIAAPTGLWLLGHSSRKIHEIAAPTSLWLLSAKQIRWLSNPSWFGRSSQRHMTVGRVLPCVAVGGRSNSQRDTSCVAVKGLTIRQSKLAAVIDLAFGLFSPVSFHSRVHATSLPISLR
jgi:hypothetical protein